MSKETPKPSVKPANQRGAARLAAVQALYQMDVGHTPLNQVLAEFEAHRLGQAVDDQDGEVYRKADAGYFRSLVKGVVEDQRALDPMIHRILTQGWPLSRLDALLRAVLRCGAHELKAHGDIPQAIIINEYMDIAGAFYEGDEKRITNAVLDGISKLVRDA